MIQKEFARNATIIVKEDDSIVGLAAGGSWITNDMDEYSDLDLVLITRERVSNDPSKMMAYARRFGKLLNGFTGEHVGEPRVLICLYDEPLLHVDIKFLVEEEFSTRVEDPVILHDTNDRLKKIIQQAPFKFPYPDYQWIEDRIWIWVHYALLKIGRGEFMEALDFFGFMRMQVLGPLAQIKNGNLPRGVRKAETLLSSAEVGALTRTIPAYNRQSLLSALEECVAFYRKLRLELYDEKILQRKETEFRVMEYFEEIRRME